MQEYLKIDFNKQGESSAQEINKIKDMVNEMIRNNKYGERPVIEDFTEEMTNETTNDVDDFIKKETPKETPKEKSEIIEYEENILIDGSNKIDEAPTIVRLTPLSKEDNKNIVNEETSSDINTSKSSNNLSNFNNNLSSVSITEPITNSEIKLQEVNKIMGGNITTTYKNNNEPIVKESYKEPIVKQKHHKITVVKSNRSSINDNNADTFFKNMLN